MKKFFHITFSTLVFWGLMSIGSCRKQYSASSAEMTDYGWVLYEQGDYSNSATWFQNAIENDTTYKDGYNGLGWSYGKLVVIDSSIKYLTKGIPFEKGDYDDTDVDNEIKAGLCFAYNARGDSGDDFLSIIFGDSVLAKTSGPLQTQWVFSHDTTLNYLDLRLTLGMSNYKIGSFTTSLDHVADIWAEVNSSVVVTTIDVTTVNGRRELATQLDTLRTLLASP